MAEVHYAIQQSAPNEHQEDKKSKITHLGTMFKDIMQKSPMLGRKRKDSQHDHRPSKLTDLCL